MIWDGNGHPIPSFPRSLVALFKTGNDFITDPRVLFDPKSGHWFATLLDGAGNMNDGSNCGVQNCFVVLAISVTNNPVGNWFWFRIPYGKMLPDQPKIATSDDKLVISVDNVPGGSVIGSQIFVGDKMSMINAAYKQYSCSSECL